jgi:hypothetical protein
VVPFCDPVGWVESYGPVLGPILAALSVVAYPVYLISLPFLAAAQVGQMQITLGPAFGEAVAQVLLMLFLIAVVVILAAIVVGVVFLGCVTLLFALVLRGLLEPAPINEPWTPRRWPGCSAQVG